MPAIEHIVSAEEVRTNSDQPAATVAGQSRPPFESRATVGDLGDCEGGTTTSHIAGPGQSGVVTPPLDPRIVGERVVLRKAVARDLQALVELRTDPEVRRYLGGPRPADIQAALASASAQTAGFGSYVIADADTDDPAGVIELDHRNPDRPGHVHRRGSELELSYLLRRTYWRRGLATEASRMLLGAAARSWPDQPVVIVTQTRNHAALGVARRLGFEAVTTFSEFGAEQWLGTVMLHQFL